MKNKMLMSPAEAVSKLKEGNRQFVQSKVNIGDVSEAIRRKTFLYGQHPYAIILTCSDARVVPDAIFSAGIGDLFVIRVAGNVIDDHQLGSIEYAAGHLGSPIVVVLGHTHCGAVDAAINHDPEGYIKFITDEIKKAIGDETDDYKACVLNVKRSIEVIEHSLDIRHIEEEEGLRVLGAMYDLETGKVEFL
ncbi:MAG: carbonic anhydrase [Eubacteriales bacterium]|nr:carbonic anhydrase [Eubacteriales bacterium]